MKCISNNPMVYANMHTNNSNIHNTQCVISKQKIPNMEGEKIAVSKAVKLSIKITDKKTLNTSRRQWH